MKKDVYNDMVSSPDIVALNRQQYNILVVARKNSVEAAKMQLGHLNAAGKLSTAEVAQVEHIMTLMGRQ